MHLQRRILLPVATIAVAVAIIVGASFAFFSDSETSQDNKLQAGALDLKIDNTSYYNNQPNPQTTWELNDLTNQLFFNFADVKPGDIGEDTISLHAENDCWVCAVITLSENDDETCTEPELIDDPTCTDPDAPGSGNAFDGELAQNINFIFWADDGDNVLEDNEATPGAIIDQGTAQDVLNNNQITLADSTTNNLGDPDGLPMPGGITKYIGKAWCFGTLSLAPLLQDGFGNLISPATTSGGVTCDGSLQNNATQTDKVLADIQFVATQARHNPNFVCEPNASPTPTPTPTPSPTPTPTPSPEPCGKADVMLVLDRSGSIDATELGQLKTAATDFVDSLGLTADGIHAGQSSFATSGTLDQTLTSSEVSMDAAIAALTSGGFTNLKSGIDLATGELTGVNDRPDDTSPDKMIIVTDGHPNRPFPSDTADDVAEVAADAARAAGIEVFVVGVGSDVNDTYLQNAIADDAAHYFSVDNYAALKTTLDNLDICPNGT